MKIISKFKDYFHYLVGVYGEDPLIVLDSRECMNMNDVLDVFYPRKNHNKRITLYIGGYKIEGFLAGNDSPYYNESGKIYWGDKLKEIDDYNNISETYKDARIKHKNDIKKGTRRYIHDKSSLDFYFKRNGFNMDNKVFIDMNCQESECIFSYIIEKDINKYNEKENCPILYKYNTNSLQFGRYPNLSDFNLNTFISPEDIYHMVSSWISEQKTKSENKPDNRTDIEKLVGKGFDKKISFRNIKK